jgi:Mg/Co/Ni transporter MgtE
MQRRIVQEVPQKYQHELLEELDRYTRIVNERIRILLNLSPERLTQVLQQLTPEDRRQVMEDIYRHQRILEDERRRNQQRR